ncbi:MAG TPA: 30S ribosomal protein S20 [Polyangiaceae bacterium]
MANHPSAEKRNRQRTKRSERNSSALSTVRTAVKKARVAISAGDSTVAAEAVSKASKLLARAASKGVVHDHTASRTTSRIQSQLNKLGAR